MENTFHVYKIRLVGTVLYYTPKTGRYSQTTNLSEHGKIYHKKPNLNDICGTLISEKLAKKHNIHTTGSYKLEVCCPSFEIVRYTCTEQEVI